MSLCVFRTEKNATPWSKEKLQTLLEGLVLEDEHCEYCVHSAVIITTIAAFLLMALFLGILKPFIFFGTGNQFAETGFLPVAPRLLSVNHLLLHTAVAHIPDARTSSQRNKGQWRIKAVGAERTDVVPP